MRRIVCGAAAGLALAAASGAFAQTDPSGLPGSNPLEKWIIHWVGPVVIETQKTASDEYYAFHTQDLVMPFGPVAAGDCRMTHAHLIIRRDGTGEFNATTMTVAANGGFGANHHLRQSLVFLDMPVLQQPEAYIGGAASLFAEDGSIANEGTRKFAVRLMEAFATWIDTVLG